MIRFILTLVAIYFFYAISQAVDTAQHAMEFSDGYDKISYALVSITHVISLGAVLITMCLFYIGVNLEKQSDVLGQSKEGIEA